ncbi:MAG: hypothetical protein EB158_08685 [Nitrosopumilaceae archaeon]|nr:hypothetical protein [Nitrosopumilaceae archaeon]
MNTKLAALAIIFVAVGLVGSAYAHKSQVIGDYKVGAGWVTEPPVVGKANQIEVMISSATKGDKTAESHDHKETKPDHKEKKTKKVETKKKKTAVKSTKPTSFDNSNAKIITISADSHVMKMDSMEKKSVKKSNHDGHDEEKLANGVTGLAKDLQVDITLNGKKSMLNMTEDSTNPGRYLGNYTPDSAGYPTVHIFVTINGKTVEGSFHPEEVKKK